MPGIARGRGQGINYQSDDWLGDVKTHSLILSSEYARCFARHKTSAFHRSSGPASLLQAASSPSPTANILQISKLRLREISDYLGRHKNPALWNLLSPLPPQMRASGGSIPQMGAFFQSQYKPCSLVPSHPLIYLPPPLERSPGVSSGPAQCLGPSTQAGNACRTSQ